MTTMARGARIRGMGLLWSGLLLLGVMIGGCSGEKQGATEPGGGATAASPKGKASATATSPPASDRKEPEKGGHGHAEGAAPHDDAASGPVVALTAIERANIGLKTEAAERRPFDDVRRLPGVMKAAPDRMAIVTSRTPAKSSRSTPRSVSG